MRRKAFDISLCIMCLAAMLWSSGIVPAIIPQSVPTANKTGNGTRFQLSSSASPTPGNCGDYDASGNLQDFGAPCNGTAGSVAFNNITSGTNTTMAALMGAGGTLTSTSTGVLESNKTRNYTVATLPAATAGMIAYVTDGASPTDCTTGLGSTKVLCQANGSAFVAVGSSGGGFVLLEEHTASNSANLAFTTCLSATYDTYEIDVANIRPVSSGADIRLQVSTNGGVSYDTGSHYIWQAQVWVAGGASNPAANPGTFIPILGSATIQAGWSVNATMKLWGVAATVFPTFTSVATGADTVADPRPVSNATGSIYNQTGTAVNAFQIIASTGNLNTGNVRCYGIAK